MTQNNYRPVPPIVADIQSHEGLRLIAYDDQQPNRKSFASVNDVRGVPTVGWGHTKTLTKRDVVRRRRFTREQCVAFLMDDMADAVHTIHVVLSRRAIDRLSENQYAALISFVFNCGLTKRTGVARKIEAGRLSEVPDELIKWVYDDGVRLQGLVNRRRAEIDLWRRGETSDLPATAAVAPHAQPPKSLAKSKIFASSVVSGLSGVGTAATAAIAQLQPHANSGILQTVLITFVCISTASAFLAAMFRAQEAQQASA